MGKLIKGDVVVIPFPFSDLTSSKRRPAFVLANLEGNDIILCQITGKQRKDRYAIELKESHFEEGNLNRISHIRPNRIFTADSKLICYKIGKVIPGKIKEVQDIIFKIFS